MQGEKCIANAKPIELLQNEWAAGTKMREVELEFQQIDPPEVDEEDEDRYSEPDHSDSDGNSQGYPDPEEEYYDYLD